MAFIRDKKIILSAISALAIIGSGVWFVYFKNQESSRADQNFQPVLAVNQQKNLTEKEDADKDGLKDWEEKLWGADMNNADTDGDGVSDGQEVKMGRNPLKSAEETDLAANESIKNQLSGSQKNAKPETLTAQIARDYFNDFIALKNQGLNDEQIKDELYNSLISRLEKEKISASPYSANEFSAAQIKLSGNSKENIKNYLNALGSIIKTEFGKTSLNEMVILNDILTEASDTGDYGGLGIFNNYQASYLEAAGKMRELSAPATYATHHIDLINNFINLAEITRDFANFGADPFKGILAIQNYQQEVERSSRAFSGIVIKILADKMDFKPNDSGYIFVEIDKQLNAL